MPGIDRYTILCCHFSDAVGSSEWVDSSSCAHVVEPIIGTSVTFISTFGFQFPPSCLGLGFANSGATVLASSAAGSPFAFGTNDWTIDAWVFLNTSAATIGYVYDSRPTGVNGQYATVRATSGAFQYVTSATVRITSTEITLFTWVHLALVHGGSNTVMYLNGTQSGVTFSDSAIFLNDSSNNRPYLGGNSNSPGTNGFGSALDEFRVSLTARWSTTFTPPAQPYDNALGFNNSYVSKTEVFNCKPDSVGY